MKTLNKYINEALSRSHSDRINETLTYSHSEHINEWKANDINISNVSNLKNVDMSPKTKDDLRKAIAYVLTTDNDFSKIDTSSIDDMSCLFDMSTNVLKEMYGVDLSGIEHLDLSCWDTSNVSDMHDMFNSCKTLKTLDLSGWDISKVWDMRYMFADCENLESIFGFSDLDLSDVKDNQMFTGCKKLLNSVKYV